MTNPNTTDSKKEFQWDDKSLHQFINSIGEEWDFSILKKEIDFFKQSKLKEAEVPKRIEVAAIFKTKEFSDGSVDCIVHISKNIPSEKYEAVKNAIEQVLNNEVPEMPTLSRQGNFGRFNCEGEIVPENNASDTIQDKGVGVYQTVLKDCDCKGDGVIVNDNTAYCRWCTTPYANGGMIYYPKERFEKLPPKEQTKPLTEEVKEYLERLLQGKSIDKTYLRHLIHKLSK